MSLSALISNQDKLSIYWHPGCIKLGPGKYQSGAVGRRGPGAGPETYDTPWVKPEIPACLSLTINFNTDGDPEEIIKLRSEILNQIKSLGDDTQVILGDYETSGKYHTEVVLKKECIEEDRKNRIEHAKNCKIDRYIRKLRDLGADVTVPRDPAGAYNIPEEYIQEKRAIFTIHGLEIGCDCDTTFYKIMKESGVLEKNFPKWYAEGSF